MNSFMEPGRPDYNTGQNLYTQSHFPGNTFQEVKTFELPLPRTLSSMNITIRWNTALALVYTH